MKIVSIPFCLVATCVLLASCNNQSGGNNGHKDSTNQNSQVMKESYATGTFGYDLQFLNTKDSGLIVLRSADGASQIIISPKYQAKVFTSTADGFEGKSFGWVNYKAFDGPLNPHMNGYGGEDRLWLGPEGGKFSLFFKPGSKQGFEQWFTPAAIDSEAWNLISNDGKKVSMAKDMNLQNYAGTTLQMSVGREVELIDNAGINSLLGINIDEKVKSVGFKTMNSITNTGSNEWNDQTGAPCTWNLDMFMPSEKCVIVIPYISKDGGKVATTDYFGEIGKDRIKMENGILYFKADGKSRGKLGVVPQKVKNIAGSYDGIGNVLTITLFDVDNNARYLNQEWRTDRDPYSGDGMNAYNDGPLEDGSQMGPFYEIESVSPPAFLKPGQKMTHNHSVFHFTGNKAALSDIAKRVLGVTIDQIEKAF